MRRCIFVLAVVQPHTLPEDMAARSWAWRRFPRRSVCGACLVSEIISVPGTGCHRHGHIPLCLTSEEHQNFVVMPCILLWCTPFCILVAGPTAATPEPYPPETAWHSYVEHLTCNVTWALTLPCHVNRTCWLHTCWLHTCCLQGACGPHDERCVW